MLLTEKHQSILESTKFVSLSNKEKSVIAQLIENQERELTKDLNESIISSDIASFTPILVPLVRRAFPALVSNAIVGIQPLQMPTGYLYAMTYRYAGDSTNPISPIAKGQVVEVASATNFVVGGNISSASGATGIVSYIEGKKLLVELTGAISFVDGQNVDNTAVFAATDTTIVSTYSNIMMFNKVLKNYSGPYATSVAEQLGNNMKEVGFDIQSVSAVAKSRKLKGRYTIEMFQDLKSMHGLDAEQELMDLMAMELQLEIDREVISRVNTTATIVADANISTYNGRWEIEKYKSLAIKISNEAREIGRLTRRGGGNTMIVSPKVAVALEQIGSFVLSTTPSNIDVNNSGIQPQIGTFNNRYKVVVDNFAETEYATVLYKGQNNKDAGMFLAPYTAAGFTKVVDPTSGQPAVILNSRYDIVNNPLAPETYFRTFGVNFSSTVLA